MSQLNPQGVPYLDLSEQFAGLEQEWLDSIRRTGSTGSFVLGPNVTAFEQEFAAATGVDHAVAVANGTDALILSLRALGVGPGDEVITTPYTFFATAEVVTRVGATPVFVDIDERSFNLDIDQIESRITPRTRAILPVHLFGYPVAMTELMALAQSHGLKVIEDCAQACGAVYQNHRVGSFGDTGCFSFYPTKVLGCYGDGGLVTTRDHDIAERIRRLRNHGATGPFLHDTVGYNSRLDEIQASLLRIKLRNLDDALTGRRAVADAYDRALAGTPAQPPHRPEDGGHAFNLYTVRLPERDRVRQRLADAGIGCSVCYPLPLHLQEVYVSLGYRAGDLPRCEQASRECLSLPIYPELRQEQIDRVCEVIRGV